MWTVGAEKYGCITDEKVGNGDGECGNWIWWMGTPAAVDGAGADGDGAAEDGAEVTAEKTADDAAGGAGIPPNPGRPKRGKAGWPSIAVSRTAMSCI